METMLLLQNVEARERLRGPYAMNLLEGPQRCNLESCEGTAKITLGLKAYCLEHFIEHCYDRLDQLDPRIRTRRGESSELNRLRESVEECCNRALLISLRCETLTNQDRSRLLDILLWSSDLLFLLNISARDFDLLTAFRTDSEAVAGFETPPGRPAPPAAPGKAIRNS